MDDGTKRIFGYAILGGLVIVTRTGIDIIWGI